MSDEKDEPKGISRRGFLKEAAVAAATGAAGSLILDSEAIAATVENSAKNSKPPAKASQMSVYLCVIGGAGSGLIAAAAAPIKGLYAAGIAVGNWQSIGYGPFGSCFSFTTYSGYAAGKNTAKFVLGKA
jgi:hypothetical protein